MVSGYFIWFIIFSVVGWIFETIFCSVVDGFYQNRGFLYGPVCPIYGLGAVFCIGVADVANHYGYYDRFSAWQVFLIGYIFSAVLEYSVHYLLEKKFHATWWDYKNMPLNINGRICVPASTLFGLSYMFIFKFVYPLVLKMRTDVPSGVTELVAMILVALLAVDAALTISALKSFENELRAMDDVVNTNMIALSRLMKEKKNEQAGVGDEKTRLQLAVDMAKGMARNMSAVRVAAINRVKSFVYPHKISAGIETLIKEIKKRSPFYRKNVKEAENDHEGETEEKML